MDSSVLNVAHGMYRNAGNFKYLTERLKKGRIVDESNLEQKLNGNKTVAPDNY